MVRPNGDGIDLIRPLYRLANILAISPPFNDHCNNRNNDSHKGKSNEKKRKLIAYSFKLWSTTVCVTLTLTYAYMMEGVFRAIFKDTNHYDFIENTSNGSGGGKSGKSSTSSTTVLIIQVILFTFIVVTNVVTIIGAGYSNIDAWTSLLNDLRDVNAKLGVASYKRRETRSFYISLIVGHIFFLAVVAYDWYEFGGFDSYLIITRSQFYYIFVTVVLTCFFASSIRHSFYHFNKLLKSITKHRKNVKVFTIKPVQSLNAISPGIQRNKDEDGYNDNRSTVTTVTNVFVTLTDIVELHNRIFGWQTLMLMGIVLMTLLETFNFILVAELTKNDDQSGRQNGTDECDYNKIPSRLLTTVQFLIWGLAVIMFCDKANKEIQNSATISFQILPDVTETAERPDFRKILYLAQQTANRCPQLSAANVFDVNVSTLFTLIGSLTTYVVVVIQFNTMQ